MGKRRWTRYRGRDLRPDSELSVGFVDLVVPVDFCDSVGFVFGPALEHSNDGGEFNTKSVMRKEPSAARRSGESLLKPPRTSPKRRSKP